MVVYKVFYKNYELKKGEFVGMLVERRKNLRGKTQLESGLRWARLTFGHRVRDERAIFAVPDDLKPEGDTERILEMGVLTRWDLFGMFKPIEPEIKKRRRENSST
jgi:hypothetical protein